MINNFSKSLTKRPAIEFPSFRLASVPNIYDNIKVIVGSEETIFEDTYVVGVLTNNRVVKFKKSSLVYGGTNG